MSKNDENKIDHRLKILSQIEPSSKATNRAIQRTRDTLVNKEKSHQRASSRIWRNIFKSPITKFAAAAVLLIAVGYTVGRASAPQTLDVEELQATLESSLRTSLEPAIRQDLIVQFNEQWQSAFAVNSAQLKEELHQQVRRDLTEFAAQTLAASGILTNQRLMELIQLIEAARIREREQVAAALQQIEQDKIRLENGLLAVAAQTNELIGTKQ
ncbi:MAG TPA: hypothetical protein VMW72_16165 [Sedimentisphaerales bacterium]|nr:hypothetical protein [Sedimentisphaerales bacterium]